MLYLFNTFLVGVQSDAKPTQIRDIWVTYLGPDCVESWPPTLDR